MFLWDRSHPARSAAFAATHLLLAGVCLARGPILGNDTNWYVTNHLFRPPLYPLLIDVFHALFGGRVYEAMLVVQILLGFGAAIGTAHVLRRRFDVSVGMTFAVSVLLVLPYVSPAWIGNMIMSEALGYPLLVASGAALAAWAARRDARAPWPFLALASLAVLARRQFVILYPIGALVMLVTAGRATGTRPRLLLAAVLAAWIGGTELVERSYHAWRNGVFSSSTAGGIQLAVAPLFFSEAGDEAAFEDPVLAAAFRECHGRLREGRALAERVWGERYALSNDLARYEYHYEFICWHALVPSLNAQGIREWERVDREATRMARVLIGRRPGRLAEFWFHNLAESFGGYAAFGGLLALAAASFAAAARRDDRLLAWWAFVLLVHLANHAAICLVQRMMDRYTAPTLALVAAAAVVLFDRRLRGGAP
jgi:hypothetical protein